MRLLLLFIIVVVVKIAFFFVFISNPAVLFSGGSDADFYDAYALGEDSMTSSVWPDWLRLLNQVGLYSRVNVSIFLMLLGVVLIPILCGRLALVKDYDHKTKIVLGVALAVSMYPTLFYYTLDIYRDVFMLFLYLSGLLFVKWSIQTRSAVKRMFFALVVLAHGYLLYLFRGYLGFSFLVAFFGFFLFRVRKISFFFYVVPLLVVLNVFYVLGLFDSLMAYRGLFDGVEGGASLGIRFDSAVMFIPDFILNFLYQLFGLYFPNIMAVFVFVLESIPFLCALVYIVKNRAYADSFVNYMFVFSIVYSIIWLLGNDNLGTAMRLRMYTYVSFIICSLIIFQRKKIFLHAQSRKHA
ncbi:hypothetical protein HBO43_08365 [Pseudomonas veronii]|jgi:hypothetical protein|uniref:EpsG family protein n=1 Tax=Pseudomonas veronii TaxID=76761 RepID=A0A0R3BLB8_PSEVE|nr:hypothetical protein [Pseudomonas veronii]SEC10669.1 hypothetical protein SAMN04490199_3919 [Pseudomonas marginalis]KRP83619.1 membrane protein [Pseudomonas veronii]NMX96611.1 hypothetical protein [Pseudomonas veronii]RTY79103.1 hypothetical protein EKA83_06155 [Pseudomonas veronii]RWA26320.1 hypothetical protein DJ028_17755 [Pseudomonas veronii]